jgi:hypothetical protein
MRKELTDKKKTFRYYLAFALREFRKLPSQGWTEDQITYQLLGAGNMAIYLEPDYDNTATTAWSKLHTWMEWKLNQRAKAKAGKNN